MRSCKFKPALALAKSKPHRSIIRRMLAPVDMAFDKGNVVDVNAEAYFS